MTVLLFISADAEKDIDESFIWYELQQHGLGERFISVLDESFIYICESPEAYPLVFKNIKKHVLRKFPFNIYYRIDSSKQNVEVIRILHHSRKQKVK